MDMLKGIYSRRSVRKFTKENVNNDQVMEIINAGRWAPSGLNNQPWRFVILRSEDIRNKLAGLTKYGKIISGAPVCIAVFIDKDAIYNETKDHQGIGACLQNMLLATHALELGAVWLGEILKSAKEARSILQVAKNMELMAVIALGHPQSKEHTSHRKELNDLIIKDI